jgi:hypothetical protein
LFCYFPSSTRHVTQVIISSLRLKLVSLCHIIKAGHNSSKSAGSAAFTWFNQNTGRSSKPRLCLKDIKRIPA